MSTPVWITGLGAISALGNSVPATLDALAAGERRCGPVSLFDSDLECPVFEVRGIPPDESPDAPMRTVRLARHAVAEALSDAGLAPPLSGLRVGVCLGTTVACQLNDIDFYARFRETGAAPMQSVERYLKANLADAVAQAIGAQGPGLTVANACSSGTDAIGTALSWLQCGLCDIAVAGGADELNRVPLCGFNALSVTSEEPCKPYHAERRGLNLGEGAGVLVLETEESVRARGVTTGLRLGGYGSYADAYHLTAPSPEGASLEAAIREAVRRSGVAVEDIAFVNAHGTATRDNDKVEGSVLARVFGPALLFVSTKGYTGHTLGAAGGLEAVFTALALREGWAPASAGFEQVDEEIGIAPLAEKTALRGRHAVSTSLAFGGNNSAIVMEARGEA